MRVFNSDNPAETGRPLLLVGFLQLSCLSLQCLFFSIEIVTLKHDLVKAVFELKIFFST